MTITLIYVSSYDIDHEFGNKIYAQSSQGQDKKQQELFEVMIPKGTANPEVDITNLAPRQWYLPKEITISQGDNITWINEDTEPHTVTSGVGAGIESLLTNKQGRSNGIFDSGLFGLKESWSYNFTESGRYTYFCTIHPWMEGVIVVELGEGMEQQQEQQEQEQQEKEIEIPAYPVNSSGSRLDRFPVHNLTNDNKYDIDMAWDPNVIVVGEPTNFIINFFDWPSNKKSHLLPYDFL